MWGSGVWGLTFDASSSSFADRGRLDTWILVAGVVILASEGPASPILKG